MLAFAYTNLPHVLCALLLLSRIGDIGTTYLVTPNLILEANPIARKLGWPFALLTLGACLLPYVDMQFAVSALVAFLLVSASNASKIWIARTIGEQAYAAFALDLARRSKLSHALLGLAATTFFVALAGGTILLFYPSEEEWGFWLGLGVLLYAGAKGLYGALATIRLFRRAASPLAGGGVTRPLASADRAE
jgi:hypothetical protein